MTMREEFEVIALLQDFHHEGQGFYIGMLVDGAYEFSDGDIYTRAQLVEMDCGARFMTLGDLDGEMSAAYAAGQQEAFKRAAMEAESWRGSKLLLHGGEMTGQEKRSCRATIGLVANAIWALATQGEGGR